MPTEAVLVVCALSLCVSLAALWIAVRAAQYTHENTAAKISRSRIAELQSAVTELHDSYSALLDSHKKLRSRIGMRQLRERKQVDEPPIHDDVPDYRTDPAGYKREMRKKLKLT